MQYQDITDKYTSKKQYTLKRQQYFIDDKGNRYNVDGKYVVFNPSKREIEVASMLGEAIGEEINIIPRINYPKKIKTPDYIINNEKYDLKTLSENNKHTIYNAIHKHNRRNIMVNIGIIGTGVGIRTYLNTFRKLENANVVAISASNKERAEKFAKENDIKIACKDYKELIDLENLDLICITAPNKYHYEYAKYCINANKNMISLGPLTDKKYCPYSCVFCYVKSDFMKYMKLEIEDIIKFLKKNKEKYNIVYISGDTDSFAPPRTDKAIELINRCK